ncbi:nucleotide sugar dehydrogenase [Nocardia sp. NPDC057455]|uniref:nucleotide sugar dehydrogenase n=1 Tax=Nocardia sp. NPDC057455 TaxID=3346138 RepID=UPI00366FBC1C
MNTHILPAARRTTAGTGLAFAASTAAEIGVIGLGYVGLPQALAFAEAGHPVCGIDTDPAVCSLLRSGRSPVDTVADERVSGTAELFCVTSDATDLRSCDAVLICVPTPLGPDRRPDLGPLISAATTVAENLQPGQLIVVESTVHPGATGGVVRPLLESGGLSAGQDFHLAFAPERIDPGNRSYTTANTPRVIGGLTAECARKAVDLYGRVVTTIHVAPGLEEAEAAKILENTYRQVNLALVHEFAAYCATAGIDAGAAITAAATKPFGFHAFYPGAGVGGHCIPVDPMYLAVAARDAGSPMTLVERAQEINDERPRHVVERTAQLLAGRGAQLSGARVLVLGLTYKPNVVDVRNTPAVGLVRELARAGAVVSIHDPFLAELVVDDVALRVEPDVQSAIATADLVLLAQRHERYDSALLRQARLLQIADVRYEGR